nr:unnamed protein product [Digitaria exilis]
MTNTNLNPQVLAVNMETYTTDDALTMMGFGRSQALVLVYAGMGWVAESMELMLLSFLGPFIREEWNISPENESMISSVVFAGMLLGSCAWGFVSDKYGRRYGFPPTNTSMFQFSTANLSEPRVKVYPSYVRSTGAGIATAIGRVGGVICPIVAVAMLRSCHQMEALVVFEVVLCLAGVACMFFPVETKGRGMD